MDPRTLALAAVGLVLLLPGAAADDRSGCSPTDVHRGGLVVLYHRLPVSVETDDGSGPLVDYPQGANAFVIFNDSGEDDDGQAWYEYHVVGVLGTFCG